MAKIKYLFLTIVVLFIHHSVMYGQSWEISTVDFGIKPSIAIGSDQSIHIAYMSENNTGFVREAKVTGNTFDVTTVATGYFYGPLDIAIDQNGRSRVVYHDHTLEDLIHARRLANGVWTLDRVVDSGHDGWDASIYIDSNNTSHMVAVDPSSGIEYITGTFNNFTVEKPQVSPFMYANGTAIVVDDTGKIHIAYYNDATDVLHYAYKENGTWFIDNISSDGRFPSMIIDKDGKPVISFYKKIAGSFGSVSIATLTEGNWEIENIDTLSNVEIAFSGARNLIDLAYFEGNLQVAYSDAVFVFFTRQVNGVWKKELVTNAAENGKTLGQQTSLVVDSLGNPHITYFERDNSFPEKGIIKYAVKPQSETFSIQCPRDTSLYCSNLSTPDQLGKPIVLNNPGFSDTITFSDVNIESLCHINPDTILRTWQVVNDIGQEQTCKQTIEIVHYDFTQLSRPTNKLFIGDCFESIEALNTGQPENFCPEILVTTKDSLLTKNCSIDLNLQRNWIFSDSCGNILDTIFQNIEIRQFEKLKITNMVIIPDDGSNSGSISLDVSCGVPGYTYFWSNGSTTESIDQLESGDYQVTVRDQIGCVKVAQFNVGTLAGPKEIIDMEVLNSEGNPISDVQLSLSYVDSSGLAYEVCEQSTNFNLCVADGMTLADDLKGCLSKDDLAATDVSVVDLVRAQRIILGLVKPCQYNLIAGDVNNTGTISVTDIVLMQRVILGIDSSFPAGENWKFLFENVDSVAANCFVVKKENVPNLSINVVGIKLGNLNCDDTTLFNKEVIEFKNLDKELILKANNQNIKRGQPFALSLTSEAETPFVGIQGSLSWDRSVLDAYEVIIDPNLLQGFSYELTDRELRYVYVDPEGKSRVHLGDLFEIRYEGRREASAQNVINIDNQSIKNVFTSDGSQERTFTIEWIDKDINTSRSKVLPNPFYTHVDIVPNTSDDSSSLNIHIFNDLGQQVYSKVMANPKEPLRISRDEFGSPGIYFVKIGEGEKSEIFRIILLDSLD